MTISFIAMSGICNDCRQDDDNVECCGPKCRLRILEEKESQRIITAAPGLVENCETGETRGIGIEYAMIEKDGKVIFQLLIGTEDIEGYDKLTISADDMRHALIMGMHTEAEEHEGNR